MVQLDPVKKWKQEANEVKTQSKYDNKKAIENRVVDEPNPESKQPKEDSDWESVDSEMDDQKSDGSDWESAVSEKSLQD